MSDTGAPYDKAIEETAKATGKALDLAQDGGAAISRPIANILIGDHIEAARERNLDARERKQLLIRGRTAGSYSYRF